MIVEEIINAAVDLIQDGDYTYPKVKLLLNQVVYSIGCAVRIPSAKRLGNFTVVADSTSTNLTSTDSDFTATYVAHARNATTAKDLTIYPNLELLYSDYEDFTDEGDIEAIAFEDYMLWSQKVSSDDQVISFVYYQVPDIPKSIGDSFSWSPRGLDRSLFVHGVASIAFGEIEDSLEADNKNNTGYNYPLYKQGITDLRGYYAKSHPHMLSGFWSI